MKKTIFPRVLSLLLIFVLCTSLFVGCNKAEVSEKGFCTVVLDGSPATEYRVNLDDVPGDQGLLSVLEYLKTAEGLTYAESGGMLSQVGNVKQDTANGVYLYIWTSVEKDFDVSQYASTKTYGNLTLTSSGVGATQMTLEKDAVIYIGTIVWS